MISDHQREILQALHTVGPSSRWELHQLTGHTPNRVGAVVESLVKQGWVREREPETRRVGRPRVPIEIDPAGQHFIGMAINPGGFTACRMSLTGSVLEYLDTQVGIDSLRLIPTAAKALKAAMAYRTCGVGVSVTGFIDPVERSLLLSSATHGQKPVSLRPFDRAAGQPVVLENDMNALTACWAMTRQTAATETVLLVWFDDGRLGSAFLADGRPYRGALAGGNELGHVRYFVETEKCFCGQVGCLERIVSSDFLRRQGGSRLKQTLHDAIDQFDGKHAGLNSVLRYLSGGLSNAVNFLRPQRLVLVTPLAGPGLFRETLVDRTRELLLRPLKEVVAIDFWDRSPESSAVDAAWLAAADLLWTGWGATPATAVQSAKQMP